MEIQLRTIAMDMWASLEHIVSKCLIAEDGETDADAVTGTGVKNPGLEISVTEAPGTKCPRCWMHSETPQDGTGLCPRCAAVVAKL